MYTWGRGDDGRLGHGDSGWKYVPRLAQALAGQVITQITCGSYHTAAVSNNGELYTWGGGEYSIQYETITFSFFSSFSPLKNQNILLFLEFLMTKLAIGNWHPYTFLSLSNIIK